MLQDLPICLFAMCKVKVGAAIFAGPGSLPLDSLCDLEQITSPGFVKSWD